LQLGVGGSRAANAGKGVAAEQQIGMAGGELRERGLGAEKSGPSVISNWGDRALSKGNRISRTPA